MLDFYLSGPMSGLPEHNFPAFNAAAARLRALGYTVCNPAELDNDPAWAWEDYLRRDLGWLLRCHRVAVLPGWDKSRGANLEVDVACRLSMEVVWAYFVTAPRAPVSMSETVHNTAGLVIKDSGNRQQFSTGAVRDIQEGKGRYDLLPMHAVERVARVYEGGAKKYGDENWRKGMNLRRYVDSAMRHLCRFAQGQRDEDHAAQAAWNVMSLIETEFMIRQGILPESLNDLPNWYQPREKEEAPKEVKPDPKTVVRLWRSNTGILWRELADETVQVLGPNDEAWKPSVSARRHLEADKTVRPIPLSCAIEN